MNKTVDFSFIVCQPMPHNMIAIIASFALPCHGNPDLPLIRGVSNMFMPGDVIDWEWVS
jgi:hypothetical protein